MGGLVGPAELLLLVQRRGTEYLVRDAEALPTLCALVDLHLNPPEDEG